MKRRNFLAMIGLAPVVVACDVGKSDAKYIIDEPGFKLSKPGVDIPLYDPRSDSNDVIFDSISSYDAKFRMTSAGQVIIRAD